LLLGAGIMGKEYCRALKKMEIGNVTVICMTKETAKKIRTDFGFDTYSGGYRQQLSKNNKPYDLAIICLPIIHLLEALEHLISYEQKNILVEKPAALSASLLKKFIHKNQKIKKISVKVAFNRLFYSSYLELKRRAEKEGGIISCHYTFTEWVNTINYSSYNPEVLKRWGICNSIHVISLAHDLIGLPKEWNFYKRNSLSWHPSGAVFSGSGITNKKILFSYHANWLSSGRWSIEAMTRQSAYRLMPLENLYQSEKGTNKWTKIETIEEQNKIKSGLPEMIIYMFNQKNSKNQLPDLYQTNQYLKISEKIFGYCER